jgi:hypothetical protein
LHQGHNGISGADRGRRGAPARASSGFRFTSDCIFGRQRIAMESAAREKLFLK